MTKPYKLYPCEYEDSMTTQELVLWLLRHGKTREASSKTAWKYKLEIHTRTQEFSFEEWQELWMDTEDLYYVTYGEHYR